MNNPAFRQRALGAIIGSAVGDALGARFEFGPAGAYSKQFPEPIVGGIGEMIGGGDFDWEPGEFTDDTQMGIVQAESILACGGIDGPDLFSASSVGRTCEGCRNADECGAPFQARLERGRAAYFRRHPNSSAGNGSLMRATPAAVHFARASEAESIEAAHQASLVTHGDPAAGWGTALFHVMIRAALHGGDPFAALDVVVEGAAARAAPIRRDPRRGLATVAGRAQQRDGLDVPRPGRLGGPDTSHVLCRRRDSRDRSRW